jgi:hypothetical protein
MLIKVLHKMEALYHCGKVRYHNATILQLKIAKQMNNTESKYTIEWLRGFKELENLSDIEATLTLSSLKELAETILSLNRQNMNELENENILKQAA